MSPISLAQVTIQSDVQEVIADVKEGGSVSEDIWISCYLKGEPSVHGKASVILDDDGSTIMMEGRDGVYIKASSTIPRAISAFDVAPNGAVYATGFDNGSIALSSTSTFASSTTLPKTSKPHASTITSLRFFPSSEVVLASSLDMSLSIISAIDLAVPRRLTGHSRSVTDTAIIERGKNVVSCAKDGTVRLWDVGTGKQIRMMGTESWSPVLKMACGANTTQIHSALSSNGQGPATAPATSFMDGEVGTHDKVLCLALQNGHFGILDLNTKMAVYNPTPQATSPPLHAIAYNADRHLIATGSSEGIVSVHDTRALGVNKGTLFRCQRNGACVEDLAFAEQTRSSTSSSAELVVGTVDGLPFRLAIDGAGPRVVEELVGLDCDPIRVVRAVAGHVWITGDDGLVRKF
ncbi:hypothetical protein FRB97_002168 [Tulasnella sp. 331]|nr:hypothetical protein FRB97_002168 [Tulasnella sp. 331]